MHFHPAARLLIWTASVILLQSFDGVALQAAVAGLLLLGVTIATSRALRLARRARWLLLALLVVFAWWTPGRLVWPHLEWLSPTAEGAVLAVEHVLRLLGLLMLVALLLELTSPANLLSGLYSLMRPLAALGVDRARAAIRLALVLRYADEELPRGRWREWLYAPRDARLDDGIGITLHSVGIVDAIGIGVAVVVCLWFWLA